MAIGKIQTNGFDLIGSIQEIGSAILGAHSTLEDLKDTAPRLLSSLTATEEINLGLYSSPAIENLKKRMGIDDESRTVDPSKYLNNVFYMGPLGMAVGLFCGALMSSPVPKGSVFLRRILAPAAFGFAVATGIGVVIGLTFLGIEKGRGYRITTAQG